MVNSVRKWTLVSVAALVASLSLTVGCNKTSSQDQELAGTVQSRIAADPQLQGQAITSSVKDGVVTLAGTTATEAQRVAAENDANAPGVIKVVNQIATQKTEATPTETPAMGTAMTGMPADRMSTHHAARSSSRTTQRYPSDNTAPSSAGTSTRMASAAMVDVPAGTAIAVRLNQPIASNTVAAGDSFSGEVARPVEVNGRVAIPRGASVRGAVVSAESAGHIKGASQLSLDLSSISFNGHSYSIQSNTWSRTAAARGKRSAEVIGGGAGLGALIGAIAGHGKGAAIGAATGAGAGTAAEMLTKPAQVRIGPEDVVVFHLNSGIRVTPSAAALR